MQMYDPRSRRLGTKYWMSEGDPTGVSVNSIQPFPGRPEAVVLSRRLVHTSPYSAGSGIYIDGVLLPDHIGSGGPDLLAVNETGDEPGKTLVTSVDVIAVRDNPQGPLNPASIMDRYDFNRDRLVSAIDLILAGENQVGPLAALPLITPSESPRGGAPGSPQTDGGNGFTPRRGCQPRWDLRSERHCPRTSSGEIPHGGSSRLGWG